MYIIHRKVEFMWTVHISWGQQLLMFTKHQT